MRRLRPPSEEAAILLAIGAVVAAVVILHMRDAVKPRPEAGPGISIEAAALTPVEVPLVAPSRTASVAPPEPAPVVPPPPVPLVPTTIREVDLGSLAALRNLTAQTGTSFDPHSVSYGELAGAGDVALVPLHSGGSAGVVGVAIVGTGRDGPQVLTLYTPDAASRVRLRAGLEGGRFVVTTAVLGAEDPLCCPSSTKRTYYAWDAGKLRPVHEVTAASVSAKD